MKNWTAFILAVLMLTLAACNQKSQSRAEADSTQPTESISDTALPADPVIQGEITDIVLSDDSITVGGRTAGQDTALVYISRDIVYYEDRETYHSGNPYGEGDENDRHSVEEADGHLVVNITEPGNYRLTGQLSLGQIRIDLGEDAHEDPAAVVNLLLDGVSITSTVAPAILFQNVYECDGGWSAESASALVDTSGAGANLILVSGSQNTVKGSHVAKIYRDQEGEKKLWKQDGAIYSYMSMNVAGGGSLDLYADNEGLDTELHLTINGGNINIRADNDGINTNEDGVSVTTINGGNLHIIAGLGAEGDGIDSNGYLVINGGTVVASANPAADAGLDSDLGSFIHGGTVIALGSAMDWAESDSDQVTMNLQFAKHQSAGSAIVVTKEDGTPVFAYDPSEDEILGENERPFSGVILSCANFKQGENYLVYLDGTVTGAEVSGVYDTRSVAAYEGGIQQAYTGTDVTMRPGMGGFGGGQRPEGDDFGDQPPQMPEGGKRPERPMDGNRPDIPDGGEIPPMPEGEKPMMPDGQPPEIPESGNETQRPEAGRPPEKPGEQAAGEHNAIFYMQDKVNFFSGLTGLTAE